MKYYKIDHDITAKIIGTEYPQAWRFTKEYEKRQDNPNAIYALSECLRKYNQPDFVPDLDGLLLSGRAKLTNFVSTVPMSQFLLFDERTKDVLLSKCDLGNHEFYETTLYVKNEPKKMYYLGLFYDIEPQIIYSDCNYEIQGLKKEDDIPHEWFEKPITNLKEIYKIESKVPYSIDICFTKIKIKKTIQEVDVYYYVGAGIKIGIVSEQFKSAIEESGLTGLVFEPICVEIEK